MNLKGPQVCVHASKIAKKWTWTWLVYNKARSILGFQFDNFKPIYSFKKFVVIKTFLFLGLSYKDQHWVEAGWIFNPKWPWPANMDQHKPNYFHAIDVISLHAFANNL